jgi:hypothetical protein
MEVIRARRASDEELEGGVDAQTNSNLKSVSLSRIFIRYLYC